MTLSNQKCVPCEGGTLPMMLKEAQKYLADLPGWEYKSDCIAKNYKFKNFVEAMEFVNKVAAIAEEQGHHPNILISYNKITLELSTHAIGGLSINDFILASKIEEIK